MSSVPLSELAYRVLRLEQQLESYQRLHAEELEEMRHLLAEIKMQVVALDPEASPAKTDTGKRTPETH